jgi:hypothetical protein
MYLKVALKSHVKVQNKFELQSCVQSMICMNFHFHFSAKNAGQLLEQLCHLYSIETVVHIVFALISLNSFIQKCRKIN